MIAILDYGVGNLFSLKCSFSFIGAEARVTSDPQELKNADKILLPGVGAFADAAQKLRDTGLADFLAEEVRKGKLLLGICLGMQLLFDTSYEYGVHAGLGLIPGVVKPIADAIPAGLKIPQIGWNALHFEKSHPLFKYTHEGDHVYFVHSYFAASCSPAVIATTDYGAPLTAAVARENVMGCQFHPEKSGSVGLDILRSFAEMKV